MRIKNHARSIKCLYRQKHHNIIKLLSNSVVNLPKFYFSPVEVRSKMNGFKLVSYAEVVEENRYWVNEFGGTFAGRDNVKCKNLLQSALSAPKEGGFGVDFYPSLSEAAAEICKRIAKNHVFHDGNKRTAWAALVLFLEKNGWMIYPSEKDVQQLIIGLVTHKNTVQDLVWFIESHLEEL
jgi:death-on-curing protein